MPDSIRTDAPMYTGLNQTVAEAGGAAILAEGSYRGERVKVMDAESLIRDALEELGASHSEKQEKELAQRDIEEGTKADQLERILKIQDLEELSKQLKDLTKDDLKRVLRQLMRLKNATPRQLREQAKRIDAAPLHPRD